jgi:lysozyme family protein
MDMPNLKRLNVTRWADAKLLPHWQQPAAHVAARLTAAKARYQKVEASTKVPWFIVAVIHEREASQSWSANLAQGDPWKRKSIHVPKGRGPFKSWEEAAVDALAHCPPYIARNTDWSTGGALTRLEQYNGLGYAMRGCPSPYLWAATDQYNSGKFIADHQFDPEAVDHQLGCVALLKEMAAIDASVTFT